MTNASTTFAPPNQPRLRGMALASVIIALMLTLLLEALDQTIVGTAMPGS
jgi:hypothetical protein